MYFAPFTLFTVFAAAVAAQSGPNAFKIPGQIQITAGKPYTVEWNADTGDKVDLTLRSGASNNLKDVYKIATGIDNKGSATFTLPADTTRNSDYTIQINPTGDTGKVNFTPQFVVESSNTVASQSGLSSALASASSAASSARSSATAMTSGSSTTGTNTRSTSVATSSGMSSSRASSASATAVTTAEAAPTGAAALNKVQGGLAAVLAIGAAALL